jgi:putative ABC transport system permease protein
VRLSNILLLYRVRLRTRAVQELFAIAGISIGVALLFASQIASTSLDGSVKQLTSGIVGNIHYQFTARDPQGFSERLLGEVQHLPGVQAAAPVLEERANVIGPTGQRSVELLGTDPRFARLGGPLLRHFNAAQLAHQHAFALPAPLAQSIGLTSLEPVELQIGARLAQGFLGAELLESDIGPLVHSPIAVAPIAYAQRLLKMPGRLSRIFVQPYPGRDREVKASLERLAGNHINVRSADFETTLFRQAAGPTNQSALLFSAISALVGFLFSFNAMLLTVAQRRSLVEDLRLDGYSRWMIIKVLLFDAVVLGIGASLLGLALGNVLSLVLFRASPGYLSFAFSIGSQRIINLQSVAVAVGGGLLAACVGVLIPLRADIFSRLSFAARSGRSKLGATRWALIGGVFCLSITTVILAAAPRDAIVGIASLIVAVLLLLPSLIRLFVLAFDHLQRPVRGAAPYLAIVELRSTSNQARSLAIAATGAIAVLGSVAIQGAHANLQRGLDRSSRDLAGIAEVWASPSGSQNVLATTPFRATASGELAKLPGFKAVRLFRSGFLDYADRRIWVFGPPREASRPIPRSQLVSGNLALATKRFREGGWALVSQAVAVEHHLLVGSVFTLPSPHPTQFKVAALTTNIGWPPGVIILNADDYARAWASTDASAYNVVLDSGVSADVARREIQVALGKRSGLTVETAHEREERQRSTTRQGLSRLTQITTLVLISAILAMAAAMGAMIWQRRPQLADMKVDGFDKGILWRALLVESSLLLGAGCSIGAVFGLYGQLLLSHALATVTGFPVVFSVGTLVALDSFLLVTAVAVLIVAIPGYLATRVRPSIILQD